MALDGLGLKDFRMFLLAQDKLDQGETGGGGLEITMPLTLGLIWAILCGDVITDLEYATRPYEVNPGQTDAVLKIASNICTACFEIVRNRAEN